MASTFSLDDVPEAYRELFPALKRVVCEFGSPAQHKLDEEALGDLAEERSRELARQRLQAHLAERHA